MRAEIITVGTEILLGEITNTDARFLGKQCARLGIEVYHQVTVGDNQKRLSQSLRQARDRSDLILVTGGLGPTPDDITRQVVSEVWDRELIRADENTSSGHQCMIPRGSVPLKNRVGTAWGFFLGNECADVACLPGPPSELRPMFKDSLMPLLDREGVLPDTGLFSRSVLVSGMGESTVAKKLARVLDEQQDPTVAIYAERGRVRVRLTTRAAGEKQAAEKLTPVAEAIRSILGKHVYGFDDQTLAGALGEILRERNMSLALAESCTGGLLGKMLTDTPGSSDYFRGGIIAYSNQSKRLHLDVPEQLLVEHGAVSREVAESMVQGARASFSSEVAASITGIAGPGGAAPGKPVGTVCFGFAGPWGCCSRQRRFRGDREYVRRRSAMFSLSRLRELLLSH